MANVSSREEARRFIEGIAKENGIGLREDWDKLAAFDKQLNDRFDKVFQGLLGKAGKAIITLAKNLYTKDVRFLFELLQNCEDNSYEKAKKRGEEPHVLFEVFSDRIITECNEDGFNAENLGAICDIGNSSKTGLQAYIGEKGIGFKSVFKVADEVIIQSGYFTFSFQHKKGESGMGMITPEWLSEDDKKLTPVSAGRTRITLMFRQDDDTQDIVESVNEQVKSLHEEMLLFMNKLKSIMVITYHENGTRKDTTTYTYANAQRFCTTLVRTEKIYQVEGGERECTAKLFYLSRYTATNLPQSKSRDYTEEALAAGTHATSDIVLAFPLSEDLAPRGANQWLFSFLPVHLTGFKFVIQADFETSVNREAIETTSKRNEALGNHIAQAFMAAVVEMCEQQTLLQYQWMRYLPSKDDGNAWDPFWISVIKNIATQLKETRVLRPARHGRLCKIEKLKVITNDANDENGKPLFNDIQPEIYLAPEYLPADQDRLKEFGLGAMNMSELLQRLRLDLDSETSRMKGTTTTYEWHRRAALLLQRPFEEKWVNVTGRVRETKLLPLRDGTWVSIIDGPVYYPALGSLLIPNRLQLKVINHSAANHPERRRLFDLLGVQTATIEFVRTQIASRYQQKGSVYRADGIADLQFMYLTHDNQSRVGETLRIKLSDGEFLQNPTEVDMYLASDDPLSPAQLLPRTANGPHPEDGRPIFIIDWYVTSSPPNPPAGLPAWVDWLHDTIGIRRDLRLKDRSSNKLSGAVQYVAKHRPSKFMLLLNKLWRLQGAELRRNDTIKNQLCETEVLCRGGRFRKLRHTYLPTRPALDTAERFLVNGDPFYWLQIEDQSGGVVTKQEWQRLAGDLDFGLSHSEVELALSILEYMRDLTTHIWSSDDSRNDLCNSYRGSNGHERVHNLYIYLEAQVRGAKDTAKMMEELRKRLTGSNLIFMLGTNETEDADSWVCSKDCVWAAPISCVQTAHVLSNLYSAASLRFSLATFFQDFVQVPKWTWKNTVKEIEFYRDKDVDVDVLNELYEDLAQIRPGTSAAEDLRHEFARKKLIYCAAGGGENDWQRSGDCLWTLATSIPGKTPINNDEGYESLKSFFLEVVGVKQLTLTMLYDKLKVPDLDISLEALKADLLEFSALISAAAFDEELEQLDPTRIRNNNIFPTRQPDGQIVRLRADVPFAIADRASLASSFRDKANLLDFSLSQVNGLGPFIRWSNLEGRYLSALVREASTVDMSSSRPISESHREIKRKAGALLRIAAACGSPRIANGRLDEFYQKLKNCETLETDRIHTTLFLTFPGIPPIPDEKDAGVLLFIADATDLKVYVPRKKADRDACFLSKLPRYLLERIMSHEETYIPGGSDDTKPNTPGPEILLTMQAVLNAHPSALKGVLGESSVPELHERFDDEVEEEIDETEDAEEQDNDDAGQGDTPSHHRLITDGPQTARLRISSDSEEDETSRSVMMWSETDDDGPVLTPAASRTSTPHFGEDTHSGELVVTSPTSRTAHLGAHSAEGSVARVVLEHSPTPVPQYAPQAAVAGPTPYQSLLEQVVNRARQLMFPSHGAFDMSGMNAALSGGGDRTDPVNGLPFLARFGRLERDKMVGAAGELFVYELLLRVDPTLVPEFGIDNWKSNIRGYVEAHPDYTNVTSWGGHETADITYTDENGALTSFLADKGYLERYDVERLRMAKPTYYLEVKSTPYSYETSFFMSRQQYQRMQNWSQSVSGQQENMSHVYIILRVFNLGKASASVKVLVDPEGMRLRGELNFEAEKWRIRPTG